MERSLVLLEAGDPISALTLAGAAEEILGRIVKRKGKEPRVEYLADFEGSLFEWLGQQRPKKKELISEHINRVRNHLKHQDDGENITIEADFEYEAEEMLLRCMYNYLNAFNCYPKNSKLRAWFDNMTL